MEIEAVILIIDVLGAIGLSSYFYKDIKKDLKLVSATSSIVPIIVFAFTMIADIKNLPDLFGQAFLTLIYGIIAGHIAGVISYLITSQVKNIMRTSRGK